MYYTMLEAVNGNDRQLGRIKAEQAEQRLFHQVGAKEVEEPHGAND